jgi:6-phosphogluconolactonase
VTETSPARDAATHLRVLPDAAGVATTVATDLLARLVAAQQRGEDPHLALTGGSIADALHRELARLGPDSAVDWGRVGFWWGDERYVARASDDRNELQARRALLDHLPVDPARVHAVPATEDAPDVAAAATAYAEELRRRGPERFEVVMLGLGPDAHIASLFPGHPQVHVEDELTVPVTGSPKPPPERVSLTVPALRRTRGVWFLVSGSGKAAAVADTLAADPADHRAPDRTPAVRLREVDERRWYLDAPAASELDLG